jgi:hypothetical protein
LTALSPALRIELAEAWRREIAEPLGIGSYKELRERLRSEQPGASSTSPARE